MYDLEEDAPVQNVGNNRTCFSEVGSLNDEREALCPVPGHSYSLVRLAVMTVTV